MKVLLNHLESPGMFGMKRYSLELADALRGLGVDARLRASKAHEVTIAGRRVGGFVTQALRNWFPVGRGAVDLVHATDHKSNPHPSADVVTVHDVIPYEAPELVAGGRVVRLWEARAVRRAIRGARLLLTDTEHVRQQLVRDFGASPRQVRAVHLGVRHDAFYPDAGPTATAGVMKPGMLNVLVSVRTDLRKRADLVLAASASLPFVHVVQVGGDAPHPRGHGLMQAIAPQLARLERERRWTRLPSVDDAALRRLKSTCDVMVHPSVAEGFGLPPLEGLACGARVLASDIPPHREVLGDAARFVALDAAAIAGELERMWDGQAVRDTAFPAREKRLAHAQRFTWRATAEATLGHYRDAMAVA